MCWIFQDYCKRVQAPGDGEKAAPKIGKQEENQKREVDPTQGTRSSEPVDMDKNDEKQNGEDKVGNRKYHRFAIKVARKLKIRDILINKEDSLVPIDDRLKTFFSFRTREIRNSSPSRYRETRRRWTPTKDEDLNDYWF